MKLGVMIFVRAALSIVPLFWNMFPILPIPIATNPRKKENTTMVSVNDMVVVDHKNGKKYDGRVVLVRELPKGHMFTVAMKHYPTGTMKYRSLYLEDCVSCLKLEDSGFVSAT
jgi:hypothetical protein